MVSFDVSSSEQEEFCSFKEILEDSIKLINQYVEVNKDPELMYMKELSYLLMKQPNNPNNQIQHNSALDKIDKDHGLGNMLCILADIGICVFMLNSENKIEEILEVLKATRG